MKNLFLALALFLTVAYNAQATPMIAVNQTETAGGDNYAISLDLAETNGTFNTFEMFVTPGASGFVNFDADGAQGTAALMPGADASFRNALLPAPPLFGGHGLTIVDTEPDNAQGMRFSVSLPGANFDFAGPVFVANAVLPKGEVGLVKIDLYDGTGAVFQSLEQVLGIPEPGTLALASMSLIGLVLRRRNG